MSNYGQKIASSGKMIGATPHPYKKYSSSHCAEAYPYKKYRLSHYAEAYFYKKHRLSHCAEAYFYKKHRLSHCAEALGNKITWQLHSTKIALAETQLKKYNAKY